MDHKKLSVILTGATGMVGEGVLEECLANPLVERVLIVNRKPADVTHPKLTEIVHKDFFDLSAIEGQLTGYNACFFCLGVSSVGMKEPEYHKLTYELTMHVGQTLSKLNKDMVFCYVSGAGTDSTEKGKSMWARVKGKTENDLAKLPFKEVFKFRPGALVPSKGAKNILPAYKYFAWIIPIVKLIAPNAVCSLREMGYAMIKVSTEGYPKQISDVKDMHALDKARTH